VEDGTGIADGTGETGKAMLVVSAAGIAVVALTEACGMDLGVQPVNPSDPLKTKPTKKNRYLCHLGAKQDHPFGLPLLTLSVS